MAERPRPTSRLLVDALVRRIQQAGGFATIVQCGNDAAGAIILECRNRGAVTDVLEKSTDFEGVVAWRRIELPIAATAKWIDEYRQRCTDFDPDSWWIELDIAEAARFADEMIARC